MRLDEKGKTTRRIDVHDHIAAARAHHALDGIGADHSDTLIR